MNRIKCRSFLKQTGVIAAALALSTRKTIGSELCFVSD